MNLKLYCGSNTSIADCLCIGELKTRPFTLSEDMTAQRIRCEILAIVASDRNSLVEGKELTHSKWFHVAGTFLAMRLQKLLEQEHGQLL